MTTTFSPNKLHPVLLVLGGLGAANSTRDEQNCGDGFILDLAGNSPTITYLNNSTDSNGMAVKFSATGNQVSWIKGSKIIGLVSTETTKELQLIEYNCSNLRSPQLTIV